MESIDSNKKKQADAEFKKGQKALATSLFKWSPDHLGAQSHFEDAAKLYKAAGDEVHAKESYLKYAAASEKTDQLSCAAQGFAQAAFLETDPKASEQFLARAQELYLIDGQGERGISSLKQYAKQQLEAYENAFEENEPKLKRIINLYGSLYKQVFEHDYYVFHQDIVDDYTNLVLKNNMWHDAIAARKQFIVYLKKEKTIDHQMRRAYLEIACLHIIADEKFKLKEVLAQFLSDQPGAFNEPEYTFAERIEEALVPAGGTAADMDWKAVREIMKKPTFGFINNEVVKKLKLKTIQAIEAQENAAGDASDLGAGTDSQSADQVGKSEQQVEQEIDDLML